jgi:hypothetical protein
MGAIYANSLCSRAFESRAKLKKMIIAANAGWLHYSESFDDGLELLKAADRMRLEVIGVKVKVRDVARGQQRTLATV